MSDTGSTPIKTYKLEGLTIDAVCNIAERIKYFSAFGSKRLTHPAHLVGVNFDPQTRLYEVEYAARAEIY